MLKACSRCGRVHDKNIVCYSRVSPDNEEQRLRNSSKWQYKREDIKQRSNYLCSYCLYQGEARPQAVEVHHITKLRDYPEGLLDDSNLITLCIEHHKQADRGEIDAELLRELANKRDGIGANE